MILRPIFAPNVILVDLIFEDLNQWIPTIIGRINEKNNFVAVNAMFELNNEVYKNIIIHQEDYEIYRHSLADNNEVSKIIINSGVKVVYFLEADAESYRAAFVHLFDLIGHDFPIICFSNTLSRDIKPGLLIVNDINYKENHSYGSNCMLISDFATKIISAQTKGFIIK